MQVSEARAAASVGAAVLQSGRWRCATWVRPRRPSTPCLPAPPARRRARQVSDQAQPM